MRRYRSMRLSLGWQIVIGLILGIIAGVIFYHNQTAITVMSNLGTIFISLIQMIVLPIVVSCLTVGIAGMGDIHKLGRVGVKTLVYFEIMTTIAIAIGLIVGNITQIGTFIDIHQLQSTDISKYMATAKSASHTGIWDTLLGIIPTNFFKSLSEGDMMPVIFFSVFFGLGTAAIGERGKIITDFLQAVSEVMFKVTNWVMKFAPIGVFGLIGMTLAEMGISALLPLGLFVLVTYATMAFFIVVVLGLVAHLFKFKFWTLMSVVKEEFLIAFSTASSEATLPRLISKMQKYGVSEGIVSFVIPTGYTFNLDGSAIYQSLAALFLAQAYGIHLTIGHQITLLVVLMITSKGMAGVPGASFVVLLATVSTIGVPMSGLTFIAGIDRFVDMARTSVNVVGNSIATIVIGKSEHEFDAEKNKRYLEEIKNAWKDWSGLAETKQLPNRSEVADELKWDLTLLFDSDDEMRAALKQTVALVTDFVKLEGQVGKSARNLLNALQAEKQIDEQLEREYVYAFMRRDSDTTDTAAVSVFGEAANTLSKLGAQMAFLEPEIVAISDEQLAQFQQAEPELAEFNFLLKKLRSQRAHVLSDVEEKLLSRAQKSLDASEEIYNTLNDADLDFGQVHNDDGKLVQLTHGNRSQFTESQIREVRKEATLAYEKPYQKLRNTFAQTFNSFVDSQNMQAQIRHYDSARQAAMSGNHIDESVYDTLVKSVNDHLSLAHRWYALKKRVLGLDTMYKYDLNVPLAGSDMLKTTFEEGKQMTLDALSVLGPRYTAGLKQEFDHRWIDAAENKGKRSGGYQISVYDANPFILLNWTDKLYSTSVLAHESGHAMHSYFSSQAQPSEYADAPIFLAEVASTFNENILTDYLLEKYRDDRQKLIFILEQYITGFIGTIYRQTQFAEFEHQAYQAQQAGTTLTADYLDQISGDLVNKYYGPSVTETGTRTQSWAYVPHFYMNYYVYQYATSQAVSTALSQRVWQHEDHALENYFSFLEAGGSDYPVNILKHAGVDVTTDQYLKEAFKVFEQRLDQIESLLLK